MTLEQTLNAAAQKLREAATVALPPDRRLAQPWHVEDCADEGEGSNDCPCIVAYTQHDDSSGFGVATHYVAEAETTEYAAWIALMHPGVGLALADWLDTAAATWAYLTNANQDAALAVARQILGDQP